jgi:hypothetical protein
VEAMFMDCLLQPWSLWRIEVLPLRITVIIQTLQGGEVLTLLLPRPSGARRESTGQCHWV